MPDDISRAVLSREEIERYLQDSPDAAINLNVLRYHARTTEHLLESPSPHTH